MKHKVAELEGPLLDAAVAKAEGATLLPGSIQWPQPEPVMGFLPLAAFHSHPYSPSTEWGEGGPILERERISVEPWSEATVMQPRRGRPASGTLSNRCAVRRRPDRLR